MPNVLLVDDHPIVRQGLSRVLTAGIDRLRIQEAVDGPTAFERLRQRPFDLVLLDLSLPGSDSGLTLLRKLRREFRDTPILVVSMHPADQFAQRALLAGAAGYVAKDTDPAELIEAVQSALRGGTHIPQELEAERRDEEPLPHELLSDREYQVLRMIGAARTVTQISNELGLSVKTVSTYRGRILQKLGLESSAELIRYALTHKIVS